MEFVIIIMQQPSHTETFHMYTIQHYYWYCYSVVCIRIMHMHKKCLLCVGVGEGGGRTYHVMCKSHLSVDALFLASVQISSLALPCMCHCTYVKAGEVLLLLNNGIT